jgi:hypothetical protein
MPLAKIGQAFGKCIVYDAVSSRFCHVLPCLNQEFEDWDCVPDSGVTQTGEGLCYVPCLILVLRARLCFPYFASFLICTYRTALPLIPD